MENEDGVKMDTLAKVYRKIAAKVQELTKVYDAEVAALKEQQDLVCVAMKDQMLALGVTSMKTAEGTVILSTTTRYSARDWDAFKSFVKEHDALDLFEKRIAQRNMAAFLEANPDTPVQGLEAMSEYSVSVRKAT